MTYESITIRTESLKDKVVITPDLARQIVALAAPPTPDATPSDVRPYLLLLEANAAVIDDLKADLAAVTTERDRLAGLLSDTLPIAAAAYEDEHSAGVMPGTGYNHKAQHLAGVKWGWRTRAVYAAWKAGADAALAELEKNK